MKNFDFDVTTVSGKTVPRNRCRYINKQYYEINVDCFFMEDDRWHRINNGKIAIDFETNRYVLIERTNLREGIVAINPDGTTQMGFFSPNIAKNVTFNNYHCLSEDILQDIPVIEKISSGELYSKNFKNFTKSDLLKFSNKGIGNRYSFRLAYSASDQLDYFTDLYERYNKTPKHIICRFSKELGNTSFGFEIETSNGFIPEHKVSKVGLIPLRDGSLRHDGLEPFEFTTIPLRGNEGINNMIDIMELIKKYTEISHQCALHVHIGGYTQSEEYVVGFHRLLLRIQDEIYSMFPSNYMFTSENGFKQKDYCSPIKNIRLNMQDSPKNNFLKIYDHLSEGNGSFKGFGVTNHPLDRENRQKWNLHARYRIANLIPFIWGKSGTVEWRCHPPTQNSVKILNWLFIVNGIQKFVEKHVTELSKGCALDSFSLLYIMKDVYSPELADKLINYIEWRKEYMKNMDRIGDEELKNDLAPIAPHMSVL